MASSKKGKADEPPKANADGTITVDTAARLIMVSAERVRQLVKADYIKPVSRGRYNLVAVVQGYIRFLKDEERRTSKSAADSRVRDARANEIEMRIAEKRRDLVPVEDATAALDLVVGKVKEEMNGLAARVTRDIGQRRKIEAEINGAQKRIAEGLASSAEFLRKGGELPYTDPDNDA